MGKKSPSQLRTRTARVSNEALDLLKVRAALMGTSINEELDRLLMVTINHDLGDIDREQIALENLVFQLWYEHRANKEDTLQNIKDKWYGIHK